MYRRRGRLRRAAQTEIAQTRRALRQNGTGAMILTRRVILGGGFAAALWRVGVQAIRLWVMSRDSSTRWMTGGNPIGATPSLFSQAEPPISRLSPTTQANGRSSLRSPNIAQRGWESGFKCDEARLTPRAKLHMQSRFRRPSGNDGSANRRRPPQVGRESSRTPFHIPSR